ncbi:MAG: membrane protein insertase YidC [Nitrospirae bacterium]|nr:membrane protein insertase YidC [Nitrospirota bacterium]
MEIRLILAIALSLAVLLVYQYLFLGGEKAKESKENSEQKTATVAGETPKIKGTVGMPRPWASQGRRIVVETELYRAELTTMGGGIVSWELKQYWNDARTDPVQILSRQASFPALAVVVGAQELQTPFLEGEYQVNRDTLRLSASQPEGEVIFTRGGPIGPRVVKKLRFSNQDYRVELKLETEGVGGGALYLGENFGIFDEHRTGNNVHIGPYLLVDRTEQQVALEELKPERHTVEGEVRWVAVEDKYFLAALIPRDPTKIAFYEGMRGNGHLVRAGVLIPEREGKASAAFTLYAGPKEYDRLSALGVSLERAVYYGWFTFIAIPVFRGLQILYGWTHNYGVAILVITVILRLLLFYPTHISQVAMKRSMKKMQQIQPKLEEIKKRYKDDTQRLNQEMMALYRKQKVNPMGGMKGCLPMGLQIPIFIGIYNLFSIAIELRHAPFAWWIEDLSASDPYYILPVIMGVSMLAQMKMSPSTLDPTQNKMMLLMPVFLTAMFIVYGFPSGLTLYWTVSNLFSIGQQYYVNRLLSGDKAVALPS